MNAQKIAINMIIGEFDEPFLKYVMAAAQWVDEIVAVDTSKDQRNFKLFKDLLGNISKCQIINYWDYEADFSFEKARNLAKKMTTPGGYIWKLDADEVYYNSFEQTVRGLDFDKDIYEVEFYHFMLDIFHYQYIETKEVLFKNDPAIQWTKGTHEGLIGGTSRGKLQDKFCHLGYVKSQKEVFKRWQKYVEIEGRPEWYDGQDPEHILDDRAEVCREFDYEYPEALREYVKTAPRIINQKANRLPKLGLILPVVGDDLNVYNEIQSIEATADYPMCLAFPCLNSTPGFMDRLTDTKHTVLNVRGNNANEVYAINSAIRFYLDQDKDVRWIGILPKDTVFKEPWGKEAMASMDEPGVGIVVTKMAAILISIDVINQIGLLKTGTDNVPAITEYIFRAEKNNFKVNNLLLAGGGLNK